MKKTYQEDYSNLSTIRKEKMYNQKEREQKAKKIIAVLKDWRKIDLRRATVLDIGCSTGIMTSYIAQYCKKIIGIDIDRKAIGFANKSFKKPNLLFEAGDSMNLRYKDKSFDVVICNQIYEHVPDQKRLMHEIKRVLKDEGACYFAATNKYIVMEPHYHLPFLSWLPKKIGNKYLQLTGKAKEYYEDHLSYKGLKALTEDFKITDYTKEIIKHPEKYAMKKPEIPLHRLPDTLIKKIVPLSPSFVWILEKRK